jgi:hypothetical protein
MNFKGAAKRLDDMDLPVIGTTIGVGEDEIHAFMEVEAAGSGFDAQGRPKMLFEPHVFFRELARMPDMQSHAVSIGLAYAKWGQAPYPKDSYPRLESAMAINETAALRSASWGLGQILGRNFDQIKYTSVQAMVQAFCVDEENQLRAIVDFLVANNIADDLRAHRWDVVARVYNGPGYAAHGYHTRLAAAFAKWQGIKDTKLAAPVDLDTLRGMAKLMAEESDDDPSSLRGLRARMVSAAADEIEMLRGKAG